MKTMFSLHLGAFLVLLIGLCSVSGQSTTAAPASTSSAPTNGSNYFYNATTTLLSLERKLPMNITVNLIEEKKGDDGKIVYTLGKPLASVNFPDAPKANFEGTKTEDSKEKETTTFTLKMSNKEQLNGDNIDVTALELNFQMVHNHLTGYWNLSTMTIDLTGKVKKNCTDVGCDVTLKNTMNVAPKKGYTSRPVDLNCQRDYTLCAPVNLCWTCYDHKVVANLGTDPTQKLALSIVIPGMRLQPLATNGTANFGYRWDCDPIWSSALWFSLLLGLFLIAILAWGIEMLATLHTPSRFDDPKGKPLVVPLTD